MRWNPVDGFGKGPGKVLDFEVVENYYKTYRKVLEFVKNGGILLYITGYIYEFCSWGFPAVLSF